MLLKRLKLVNYGGIYNGMGLYEIEIDFTKCKNRIVLIKGDNGSGKSTIENALKPLPDESVSFIIGKDACKEIEYFDELNGTIYSIKYIHECKGTSRTSKGYFYKTTSNGNTIDLNPSGNITSCKDAVSDELELDANYIALTQLSSTKRGIADLKPADRKKYVNAILSSTDVYNSMYKTLTKKSSHYKTLMNNIASKIDSTGNPAQLEEELKSVESKIREAEELIEQYTEVINKEKGMLFSIDPNNEIGSRIQTFNKNKKEFSSKRDELSKKLNSFYVSYPKLATVTITQEMLDNLNSDIYDLDYKIKNLNNKIEMMIANREKEASSLEDETAKLNSINSGTSIFEVKRIKDSLDSRKKEIEKRWGCIVDLKNITHDEFMIAYDIIKSMSEIVTDITSIIPQSNINSRYIKVTNEINQIETEIEDAISFRNSMEVHEYKLDILEQRPKTCKDDTCPFIADALNAKAILDSYLEERKNYNKSMVSLNERKNSLEQELQNIEKNKQLLMLYNANCIVLRKLNLGLDTYEDCVKSLIPRLMEIISVLNGLIEYSNDLNEYKSIDSDLLEIETKYNSLSNQKNLIDMITSTINKLNIQIEEDTKVIKLINDDITNKTKELNDKNTLFRRLVEIFNLRADFNECEESLRIINEEIEADKARIEKIENLNSDIEKLSVNISELKAQLEPYRKRAEVLRHKIDMSNEYTKEYEEYNSYYSKIEMLKYYCSPTTGIQLIFVNMYLSKIMESANNILSKLFNGTFALLPLVVTDTEFRIPVAVNGGINHDDITSMSSAQIALISMIISISLLSQTSTKLNIIVGDEIDAPFDSENRREFIGILTQLMSLVKSSQCILISHNSEISMADCDVILLKNENDVITEGNIIWSYK